MPGSSEPTSISAIVYTAYTFWPCVRPVTFVKLPIHLWRYRGTKFTRNSPGDETAKRDLMIIGRLWRFGYLRRVAQLHAS